MAAQCHLISLLFILVLVLQSSALMSDYKTCGDDSCARLLCRVQAVRDHSAQDCRFLSFKEGDMIDVYYKLSGKRSDLWAGSIDKQFGYFPKYAVKLDEVFVDEKKEIVMRTQKMDFFCMDAFGTIIASDEELEEVGGQTGESEELGNRHFDAQVSKASETHDHVDMGHVANDDNDQTKAGHGGSSWIRSAVSGWFANDADETGKGNYKQVKFKSRKLALDMDQQDKDEQQAKHLDWTGEDVQTNYRYEPEENEDLPKEQSSFSLGSGMQRILSFGQEDTLPTEMSPSEKMEVGWYDTVYSRIKNFYGDPSNENQAGKDEEEHPIDGSMDLNISKNEKNPAANHDEEQDGRNHEEANHDKEQELRNPDEANYDVEHGNQDKANDNKKQEVRSQDGSDDTRQLREGWYESVYNRITGFYEEVPDGTDAPEKRGDPHITSDSTDIRLSQDEELDDTAEELREKEKKAGWYDSVYNRISNIYGYTSEKSDVTDVMKGTESRNAKDTPLPSVNGLRWPSEGAGSDDEHSITSESMQSDVSTDHSVTFGNRDDVEDTEDSGWIEKLMDTDQYQDTSQSIFSINRLSKMIGGLESPFKPNHAEDKEELNVKNTPDPGKDEQNNNDDENDNDGEHSVISEISSVLSKEEDEEEDGEEEEEALHEVNVFEAQINSKELSLDCNKQDVGDDDENSSTDMSTNTHIDLFSDESDPGSAPLSTGQTKDHSMSVLDLDETEALSEEPGWTRLAEHVSDTSKIFESAANITYVNKSVPDVSGDENLQSESQTRSDLGLNVSIENNSETVDGSYEACDKAEAEDVLAETEETGIKVRRNEVTQINHTKSHNEEHSVDVTQLEHGGEIESGPYTIMEYDRGNITHMEYNEEREGEHSIGMGHHGENEGVDVTQLGSHGEMEVGVTQVEYSGGYENVDVSQMEFGGENESLHITQVEFGGGEDGGGTRQIESGGESDDGDVTQVKYAEEPQEEEVINFTQMESGGEKEIGDFYGLKNTNRICEINHNPESHPEASRELEKSESGAEKQAETRAKNLRDTTLPTDGSDTSGTSDRVLSDHLSKKTGDEGLDVEQPKAQTQKHIPFLSLQAHLGHENLEDLLKFFSGEILSRLDFISRQSEYLHSEEFAELQAFEQRLELLLESRSQEIRPSRQTIHAVLAMLRKKFMSVLADGSVDKSPDPNQSEQDTGKAKDNNMDNNNMDNISSINDSDSSFSKSVSNERDVITDKSQIIDHGDTLESDQKRSPHPETSQVFVEPEESKTEGVVRPYMLLIAEVTRDAFTYVMKESAHVRHFTREVVMSLPDDLRPGPDLYGLPWEAVIFTAMLGFITFLLFTCRFVHAVRSRLYRSKERRMGLKVAELLEEKCKVLETLSECEHKFKKLDAVLQNGTLSIQDSEREDLESLSEKLEEENAQMKRDLEKMQEDLDTQDQLRNQQQEQLSKLEETLKKLEEEATEQKTQLAQEKTTLKIHQMNTERLQKKLQEAKEENSMLLESKAQLEQEAEGWKERLSELEEEKRMSETSHNGMMENCISKDERIKSLVECLLKMRDWDSEEDSGVNDASGSENKTSSDFRLKQKVQKLINAAKMSADLKALEEDKELVFAKLTDEIKAKEDLQEGLEQLQRERACLESESSMYSGEIEKLQHKLQIMSEMYQEKELKLHRMLTVEEKERSQKEEQLSKAGKKISMTTDELNSYRQRAKELEEELENTNLAYRNQIAAHEKKAHDNWLAARAADRDLTDVKRENSVLRQRLTDWQFKLELMEKNPQARVPLFRGGKSPFGPSPLGRPPSETRPFLSPPTLMDGPPTVSPQFPMMPADRAPPGGVEGDRSVAYSEGGSPTWERERRSLGPAGPDPGLVYRRPLSAPFLRAPLPPEAYYNEKSESSFVGEGAGVRENGIRDSGRLMPAPDLRAGPLPPHPFPPLDPRDPHFPRRGFRPDFFPPLAMRGPVPPLPPGVFPRIPLPPHMAFPPMRPPAARVSPEPTSRPSPPGSEQPPEQPPSGYDVI